MALKSAIEWTDATWNPIRGCSRVSEGCRNCYAESVANRFCGPGQPYEGLIQIGANGKGNGKWSGEIEFVEDHLLDPLKWKPIFLECEVCGVTRYQCLCEKFHHRPRRIFVNSMSDLFHEGVTDEMRDRIWAVMALCPQHEFQVLTKRPESMLPYLFTKEWKDRVFNAVKSLLRANSQFDFRAETLMAIALAALAKGPLPNVWLGVSVEDQNAADERVALLLQTPAAKRFASMEPLLGSVCLTRYLPNDLCDLKGCHATERMTGGRPCEGSCVYGRAPLPLNYLDLVIVGGESGRKARPMHPDWARSLRDQCVAAGVPFFFKQWGHWAQWAPKHPAGKAVRYMDRDGKLHETPFTASVSHEPMVEVGKKAAGRLLDGREWNEVPA